jgi:tRNA-dihydrouridine synthase 3
LALVKARDARSAAAQTGASGSDGAGGGGGVGGSSEEAVHTGKRKRGQNKGRSAEDIGLGSAPVPRLCRWALPGAAQPCPFGERCRDEHSLAAFFAAKPVDLEGVCPVFSALGVCASGPSCRWALSHTDPGTGAQHSPASATCAGVAGNFERNAMPPEALRTLQKGTYTFISPAEPLCTGSGGGGGGGDDDSAEALHGCPTGVDAARTRREERKRLDFRNKVVLAPLTTVGNLPFRRLLKVMGVDVTVGEMAMTSNLLSGQASEWALLRRHSSETIFGAQLAGNNAEEMAHVSRVIAKEGLELDFLDINCGCPLDRTSPRMTIRPILPSSRLPALTFSPSPSLSLFLFSHTHTHLQCTPSLFYLPLLLSGVQPWHGCSLHGQAKQAQGVRARHGCHSAVPYNH